MDITIIAYSTYLIISISLTVWVGRSLFKNGQVFLNEMFQDEVLAQSISRLKLTGYYLLNIGFVVFNIDSMGDITSYTSMFEKVGTEVGTVLLVLGMIHFLSLFLYYEFRKRHVNKPQPPKFRDTQQVYQTPR